jgi:diaminohydroxyphosphoribosylaminopyrimidine deaminase/5-amino-6-(5-phosphoribosylamino)uracil reductase
MAPYLKRVATGLPFVIAKWAMTLDGKTACATGDSRWISGPRSRAIVHEVRGKMDAIIVGIGTALTDDPELTARPPGPRRALRVVLDSSARLPETSRLATSARDVPVLVAVNAQAPADRKDRLERLGCEVLVVNDRGSIDILALLHELGRRGATNVLVEGGGRVLGAFLDAQQVDAVDVYIAPKVEGGPATFTPFQGRGGARMADSLRLGHVEWQDLDGDLRLTARTDLTG